MKGNEKFIREIVKLRDRIESLEEDKTNCIDEIKKLRSENKRLLDIGCDFQHKVELLTNELIDEKNLRLMSEL